jgi:large subunit ribosomal protein L33
MAKKNYVKIRLNSSEDTGSFYVTKRNPRPRQMGQDKRRAESHFTEKLTLRKYDPKLRKHVEFKEGKIK